MLYLFLPRQVRQSETLTKTPTTTPESKKKSREPVEQQPAAPPSPQQRARRTGIRSQKVLRSETSQVFDHPAVQTEEQPATEVQPQPPSNDSTVNHPSESLMDIEEFLQETAPPASNVCDEFVLETADKPGETFLLRSTVVQAGEWRDNR